LQATLCLDDGEAERRKKKPMEKKTLEEEQSQSRIPSKTREKHGKFRRETFKFLCLFFFFFISA